MPLKVLSADAIQERFSEAGQSHVFAAFDSLSTLEQKKLLAQAQSIDLELLVSILELHAKADLAHLPGSFSSNSLSPAPCIALPCSDQSHEAWSEAARMGEDLLRTGKVTVLTVAGGQGTRLGFNGPKGAFPVTPVKQKPIFQVFAEKIRAQELRYGKPIHWFVMTSNLNHEATQQFFASHGHFGLVADHVHFFTQGEMPALGFDGKILMQGAAQIAMSPDGHGGVFRALAESGKLSLMKELGLDCISFFQVDNPLVPVLDPAFIGFHQMHQSEMSSKMVPKTEPDERVGLFCLKSEKLSIVEYSDVPESVQHLRDPDGKLTFRAGNIAVHLINRTFAERIASSGQLPFHRAHKKVSCMSVSGQLVQPAEPNAIKLEQFVFDALPLANNAIVIEAIRADEFSPVKNAQGSDSPEKSREDQIALFKRWLKAAGVSVPRGLTVLEISPLYADSEAAFIAHWKDATNKPPLKQNLYLE